MTEENAAKLSVRLQPGSQVYLAANDRVVHSVLTAKVADSAIPGIDSDAQLEGLLRSSVAPFRLQLSHPPLHCDRHSYAGNCVFFSASRLWIAEEGQNRITDVLVDCRAVGKSNHRHLS